jgi:hypothetical protein
MTSDNTTMTRTYAFPPILRFNYAFAVLRLLSMVMRGGYSPACIIGK